MVAQFLHLVNGNYYIVLGVLSPEDKHAWKMTVVTRAPRKTKTHPLHKPQRMRHPELQLLKSNPDLKPETKGRPPAPIGIHTETATLIHSSNVNSFERRN